MTLLTPLGLLGLLGIVALIIIYIIRPNYQQKFVSTTFVWKHFNYNLSNSHFNGLCVYFGTAQSDFESAGGRSGNYRDY